MTCFFPVPAILGVLLSLLIPATGTAGDLRTPHCLEVCPRERLSAPMPIILVRGSYSLAADPQSKLARWVAYKVTTETLTAKLPVKRARNWAADPALVDQATLEPADYKGAHAAHGFDRGHLAPLASLGGTDDWQTLNYLSNIAPQRTTLNGGPWEKLEAAERRLVTHGVHSVHVVTGPLFERRMPRLPGADEPHLVPSGFWKVVSIETANGIERAAFIFDQDARRDQTFCSGLVPLGDVERRAKLAFAPMEGGVMLLSASQYSLAPRLGCNR